MKKEKTIRELIHELQKDVKIVASARFNKVTRLKRQSQLALIAISFLSFTLIIASIATELYHISAIKIPSTKYEMSIWFFSILSSIFILAISIFISKNQYDLQISRLYASAVQINKIVRDLELIEIYTDDKLEMEYQKKLNEYNHILDSDHINHDTIDYYTVKPLKYRCEKIKVFCKKTVYFFHNIVVYYSLILIVSILVLLSLTSQIITTTSHYN
ncbi:SLATT domain-containing protein [Ignatzschineria rhizosphaerae]|uniref:SLATT domain-containing protein n=1 Tax=Ignatzschineria rhizosphaerae TaxID=2923279 RepID=A0ABY3X5E7_9GAMM|nr:SLATT domain-containing protein [Ignatzschineria rhizosphaerae]UNM97120.1 SLATT domain-containing protein [Ignatzschineria rhizosphaerae]